LIAGMLIHTVMSYIPNRGQNW